MRKRGGKEARSLRAVCDVCVAHGDRAAVGVDIDVQDSSPHEDATHFPLDGRVECRMFVSERILVGSRRHYEEAVVFRGFPMSLKEKRT